MPSFIVKVEKNLDLYVLWSTIVDSPLIWGTRAELEGDVYFGRTYGLNDPARWARADETGTSSMDGFFDWDDDSFIVMNSVKDGLLKRSNLKKWLDSIVIEKGDAVSVDESLIEPFPEEEK